MKYNWQQQDWPNFRYNVGGIGEALCSFSEKAGRLRGLMEALPESLQTETVVELMVAEAIKTSGIEGAYLSREDVMSSVKRNLGLSTDAVRVGDRRAMGIAELMVAVRNNFEQPLTQDTLFAWHEKLMQGAVGVKVGTWRTHAEKMLVVSGYPGSEDVHFEAPPSCRVPDEMSRFISWFNETATSGPQDLKNGPVRAAVAHVYFESIHPFEDGNGRIGRALAEKVLSQSLGRPAVLSLSQAIEFDRKAYYLALKQGQASNDLTAWVSYFVDIILRAQDFALEQVMFTLKKAKLLDRFGDSLNTRQLRVVLRMLETGPQGFEGGMSAGKYSSITGTSKATATRDLQNLVSIKILKPTGGGRSVRYHFCWKNILETPILNSQHYVSKTAFLEGAS